MPHVIAAMERQERAGVRTMVRPSGGAAVPLDEGVLHVALLLAPAMTRDACSLHRGFQQLATLVVRAVERLNGCAVIGEVAGAVCPGSYDIHIGGYKVAGISQHRSIRGTLVHAFIDVCGDAIGRARWVEQLYREAGDETQRTAGLIPPIDPNVMTTIAQATGHDALTVAQFWRILAQFAPTKAVHRDVFWRAQVRERARQLWQRYDPRSGETVRIVEPK